MGTRTSTYEAGCGGDTNIQSTKKRQINPTVFSAGLPWNNSKYLKVCKEKWEQVSQENEVKSDYMVWFNISQHRLSNKLLHCNKPTSRAAIPICCFANLLHHYSRKQPNQANVLFYYALFAEIFPGAWLWVRVFIWIISSGLIQIILLCYSSFISLFLLRTGQLPKSIYNSEPVQMEVDE